MIFFKFNRVYHSQIYIVIFLIALTAVVILFVANRLKIAELQKKLNEVEKELYVKGVNFEKSQKEFEFKSKNRREKLKNLQSNITK